MLKYSRELLSQVVDDNGRSALHFAAAINNVPCVQLLLAAGGRPGALSRSTSRCARVQTSLTF